MLACSSSITHTYIYPAVPLNLALPEGDSSVSTMFVPGLLKYEEYEEEEEKEEEEKLEKVLPSTGTAKGEAKQ